MPFGRVTHLVWSRLVVGLLLVGLVTTSSGLAQESSAGDVTSRVDSLFARWDKSTSPGCSLGISQNGVVVYERGYGMANLEHGIAITPQTVFDAASITKQFTAMAILLLVQRGQLSLDDEARKYLTELPDYGTPVTIRHLLTHTSGLRDMWALEDLTEPREWTPDDYLRLLGRQHGLNAPPGTEFLYLNAGYWLLGRVVERVSGQSLATFTDANIVRPLGMTRTLRYDDPRVIVPNRATGYFQSGDVVQRARPGWLEPGEDGAGGNAGLLSTVGDLLIWEHNFDDVRVGTPELVAAMHTKWYPPVVGASFYGFGLYVGQYRGLRAVWHTGSSSGYRAFLVRYPDQRFAIAILCNTPEVDRRAVAQRIADIFLEKSFPPAATSSTPVDPAAQPVVVGQTELAALAGTYWNPIRDRVLHLVIRDGELTIDGERLTPLGSRRFRRAGQTNPWLFPPAMTGAPQEMHVPDPGGTTVFSRVEASALPATDLQQFAGTYVSAEVGTTYTVAARGSDLVIRIRNRDDIVLRHAFADVFEAEFPHAFSVVVRFVRAEQGVVTGFTVSGSGMRRVSFARTE